MIQSTNNEFFAPALSISEQRYIEIIECMNNLERKYSDMTYTRLAEEVSKRLSLNTNEVFLLGVVIAHLMQYEQFLSFKEMIEKSNKSKVPVVQHTGMA